MTAAERRAREVESARLARLRLAYPPRREPDEADARPARKPDTARALKRRRNKWRLARKCAWCQRPFLPNRVWQKFDREDCKNSAYQAAHPARSHKPQPGSPTRRAKRRATPKPPRLRLVTGQRMGTPARGPRKAS